MSGELKVGDICVIVPPATELAGMECEIVGAEQLHQKRIVNLSACEVWVQMFGFIVILADGRKYAIERSCLRKKPPKSDDDSTPRTEFLPAEPSFVEDLQRRLTRTTEETT